MGVFEAIGSRGHEELVFGYDPASGLRSIIAIHSTALGPALGGTRFFPYATEAEALEDVLRLSQGMTLKAAAAGLDLGGGKAVLIGDPRKGKSERLWRAYGRVVDSLQGRYITAEDVGTDAQDMDMIRRETRWVVGVPVEEGGSGDPSPKTALGIAPPCERSPGSYGRPTTSPAAPSPSWAWARSARALSACSPRPAAAGGGRHVPSRPEGRPGDVSRRRGGLSGRHLRHRVRHLLSSSVNFLDDYKAEPSSADAENLRMQSKLLEKKLDDFGVQGKGGYGFAGACHYNL